MPVSIPASHKDLIEGPHFATLVTMMPDGQPQASVVWCTLDGSQILVNTTAERQKAKNAKNNPKVTLLVLDKENPRRYIEVRGSVDEITEDGAMAHINWMAQNYAGQPAYYGYMAPAEMEGKENRVLIKISPTRVVTFPMG